ncbi:hypothetical protein F2P56_001526 [Juglans regia]|uniref:J domain-containing protein n=2 Tax=Juglans regia TaxID=51240 RepID=A0A834D8L8_JUGRE|nr:chaperone protein dnaJ 20, chloroplastic-like [Juglans regia]KAF5480813.1 hypothetical protein F2P56_001526 [Juglans regia]
MEISLRMNPKIATILVPKPQYKTRSGRKAYDHDFKTISCRANELAMKKKNMTNFYEVLCLGSVNVGHDEIKKAYRNLALQCHPDVCPPSAKEESTRRFVELQKAYETLSNPISRKMYDYQLGLVKSMGTGDEGGVYREESKSRFSKEVWEIQLSGLKKRSQVRMERKKYAYM